MSLETTITHYQTGISLAATAAAASSSNTHILPDLPFPSALGTFNPAPFKTIENSSTVNAMIYNGHF